jgi:group I intron endonuclease
MSIGIYKITNPKGKIYIGQSRSIEERFKAYKRLGCKKQFQLYNSLKKYDPKNHKFEIIELCNIEQLNERERYWQDYYNVLEEGLNLCLVGTKNIPQLTSLETLEKKSNIMKNYHKNNPPKIKPVYQYNIHGDFIKRWEDIDELIKYGFTKSHITSCCNNKIKKAYDYIWSWKYQTFDIDFLKNILPPRSEQMKHNKFNFGKKQSDETKKKKRDKLLGQKRSIQSRKNISNGKLIPIIQYNLNGELSLIHI